jgi:hypothetical protein
MTARRTWRAATAAVGVLVTAVLLAVPMVVYNRLPDPLATHWGASGRPDGAMPLPVGALVLPVGLWLLAFAALAAFGLRGRALAGRVPRGWFGAGLAALAVFVVGLDVVTLRANLDVADWHEAASVHWWTVLGVIAAAAAAGLLGRWLGRRGPDETPSVSPRPLPRVRLEPGDRTVWLSRVRNRFLIWLAGAFLAAGAATAVLATTVLPTAALVVAAVVGAIGVGGLAVATVVVSVTGDGLAVGFGPWAWPRRRWPLDEISAARADYRTPAQVGGWGWRGLGNVTLMVRSGPCLVIGRRGRGEFAVSADDAEHGAALLNALLEVRLPR